jgi:predicted amidohydrolase YtcJ
MRNRIGLFLLLATAMAAQPPTAIYVNGTVITMDRESRTVQAVAVRDGLIAAVGTAAEIRKLAGPGTVTVDLKGATMVPGMIDAHSHFPSPGISALYTVNLAGPPLGDVKKIDDIVAALKLKAASTPKGQWIRGTRYDQNELDERRHPTREDLDRASTEHPIYIVHSSGHMAVANSMALKMAGLDESRPQPKGGLYQKDPRTGKPNGVLEENAMRLVGSHLPAFTAAQNREAIAWAVQNYLSQGVTTATIAGGGISKELWAAGEAGLVPLRVVAMGYQVTNGEQPPAKLIGTEMMKTGLTIKHVHDGSIQGGNTGYLTEPYFTPFEGDKNYRGYARESREDLTERVKKLNRLGYQIAIHANGDAAIDDVISAYREALKDFPRTDTRFRVEHAQTTREDQLDLMKEYGISPSFYVSHTYYWGDVHRDVLLGPVRGARISPLKSALARGIQFSVHLDSPVTPMSPLQAVWSAVNRQTRSGKVLGPEQRITPLEAMRAVTIDAAWQEHDEKIKGSIEAGKMADFTILAENPLKIDPLKIREIPVLETIVGGKSVYKR